MITTILKENGQKIEDFGYQGSFKELKKQIKEEIDKENDDKLNKLVASVIKTNCQTIKKIKSILLYLKEKNYQTNENELIKWLKK